MPLYLKSGTSSILQVGGSIAADADCCCVTVFNCFGCLDTLAPDFLQVDLGNCGDATGTYLIPYSTNGAFCSYPKYCTPEGDVNDTCCWHSQFTGCGGENVCVAVVIKTTVPGGFDFSGGVDLYVFVTCQARGLAEAKAIATFKKHYATVPDCFAFSAVSVTRTFGGQPTGCCVFVPTPCSIAACDGTSATASVTTPP